MLARVLALLAKELTSLWKDGRTRMVLVIPPLVQVMIFAYAASFDVRNVPMAVWDEDGGAQAQTLVAGFARSPSFLVTRTVGRAVKAAALIDAGQAVAVLHLPQNFSADVTAGRPAHVQLLLDARRSNTALMVNMYAAAIVAAFAQGGSPSPLAIQTRDWFNPSLEPQWFILPGLVAVLSLMMAMLVGSLSLARERELGTFEQLLVTPLRPHELLLGKAIPSALVGLLEAHIVIATALLWFRLPFAGSIWLLELALFAYMMAGAALGLAISAFARTQQQAILGVFVFASPMIILSGFAAPVENMPRVVEWLSRLDPVRYMLVVSRGVFLQDMPATVAFGSIWPMALIALASMAVASLAVRRAVA